MSDLVAWVRARLDEDAEWADFAGCRDEHVGVTMSPDCRDRVLADVAAKRAIVDAVESWPHVVNRDAWHWCPMAPETRAEFPDDIEDRCTCGRDRRALAILGPLAYAYHVAGADGWREEWRP